jgi:perosamine synthetase
MRKFIPVSEPLLDGNEKKYLNEAIDTAWISSEGPFVKEFEDKFAKKVGRKYGISVANGTAALEIAAKAIGITSGDEVVMPSFTIISCAQAIVKEGGKIISIDCDLHDFNMLVDDIESKITAKTKAIMPVHIYGLPVDMDKIISIADKYNLKIIEDAAEMHGQLYKGKPCGSFGVISVFSFYANKIITTGEGGMIVTDDEELAEKCRFYRNLCFEPKRRFVHYEFGYNYRFTNIQAAIGLAQLERIDEFAAKKREIGLKYNKLFEKNKLLNIPIHQNESAENIYWVYPLVLKSEFGKDAEFVMKELQNVGIGTRPFFYPLHLQPVLLNMKSIKPNQKLPNSEYLAEMGFYIPSSLTLSDEEIYYIAEKVNQIVN